MRYLSSSSNSNLPPLTDRFNRCPSSKCLYNSRRRLTVSSIVIVIVASITSTTTTRIHAFSPHGFAIVPSRRTIAQQQQQSSSVLAVLANPKVNDESSISIDEDSNSNDGSMTVPSSRITPPSSSSSFNNNDNDTTNDPKDFNWSFLEKAYIITCPNADPNGERLTNAKSILAGVGLDDGIVEVKEFATDDEDRIRGCYTSHISVIQDAIGDISAATTAAAGGGDRKRNGTPDVAELWRQFLALVGDNDADTADEQQEMKQLRQKDKESYVLILEDNIGSNGSLNNSILQSISTFLSSTDYPTDMFHLSYIPYVPNLTVTKTPNNNNNNNKSNRNHVVQLTCGTGSALGTTAYIISSTALQTLSTHHTQNGYYAAIPDIMAELFPTTRYASNPTPFLRSPSTTSLVNPQLDDLRSLLFRPAIVSVVQDVLVETGLETNTLFFG